MSTPPWFHGIRALITILAGLATIAGTVIGVLVAGGVIGGDKPTPIITNIDTDIANFGQQINISVANVSSILEVSLIQGDNRFSVPFTRADESKLFVTVPENVEPGEYDLEVKTVSGETVSTPQKLKIGLGGGGTPPTSTTAPETVIPAQVSTPTPTFPTSTPEPTAGPQITATTTPGPPPVWKIFTMQGSDNLNYDGAPWEKIDGGAGILGVYVRLDDPDTSTGDAIGDFLELKLKGEFSMEKGDELFDGQWKRRGNEIILTLS